MKRIVKTFILFLFLCTVLQVVSQPGNSLSTTRDYVLIRKINLIGNKVTKDKIIMRELLFHENDTVLTNKLPSLIDQSRKNLINTSLFNFVTFTTTQDSLSEFMVVTIEFIERWYIWPVPIFEFADRNFNEWLKKKDWNRINYGVFLTWNNFRGRREKLILYTRFGYDEKYNLTYQIPYINKKQTLGLGFSGGFSQNHEIAYNSENNKEVYYKSEQVYPQRSYFAYMDIYYRKGIHNFHRGMIGYNDLNVSDSVILLNPDFSYDPYTRNQYLVLFYQFRSDFRDFKQYALNGYYFDAEIDKKGIGLFGSDVNALYIKSNFRKYQQIKGRFYWASGITGKVSPLGEQPYYYTEGLGYGRDYLRGYEYYVVDGQHFVLLKNNLKFELVKMHEHTFHFIPSKKFNKLFYAFFLNLYADLGYVADTRKNSFNPLANEILTGYGIGLDFVTYYDFVLRLEYSFNKMGESGFFISFLPSI